MAKCWDGKDTCYRSALLSFPLPATAWKTCCCVCCCTEETRSTRQPLTASFFIHLAFIAAASSCSDQFIDHVVDKELRRSESHGQMG